VDFGESYLTLTFIDSTDTTLCEIKIRLPTFSLFSQAVTNNTNGHYTEINQLSARGVWNSILLRIKFDKLHEIMHTLKVHSELL